MATLELIGLTKRFGSFTAVDNMNLKAADGEIIALLGGSGTFFKCALGCAGVHFLKKGTAYFGIGNFHGTAPLQKLENRFAVLF